MFGRGPRSSSKDKRPGAPLQEKDAPQRASGGMSLDAQSLMVPSSHNNSNNSSFQYRDGDEGSLSSINTSTYGGMVQNDFKILGVVGHDNDSQAGMDRGMDIEGDTDADTIPPQDQMTKKQRAAQQHEQNPYHYRANHNQYQYPDPDPDGAGPEMSPTSRGAAGLAASDSRTKTSHSKNSSDSQEKAGVGASCIPVWITEAPLFLKLIIVLSTALLVGAIVLIGVGAALAIQEDNDSSVQSTNNNANDNDSPAVPTFATFTLAPAVSPNTDDPTMAPVTQAPIAPGQTRPPTRPPTMPPTMMPTMAPTTSAPIAPGETRTPTPLPSVSPTSLPTSAPTPGPVTFLVTAGRFDDQNLALLPDQLQTLPNAPNTVMFHLGDWNSPFSTQCTEVSYQDNQALYSLSTVPVYFVVGDNEYNDCPNPEVAMDLWYTYNLDFETKFWPAPTEWNITRQVPFYRENFAYTHQGILFVGINLVGGEYHDDQEWQDRHRANLVWINAQYQQHVQTITTMVVLAHSAPPVFNNFPFFTQFLDDVENVFFDIQVLFIHRNLGVEPWGLEPRYDGIDNLMVVVVEGSVWPPMLVEIDAATGVSDFNQDEWYNQYLNGMDDGN